MGDPKIFDHKFFDPILFYQIFSFFNFFFTENFVWHFKPNLVKISPKVNSFDLNLVYN